MKRPQKTKQSALMMTKKRLKTVKVAIVYDRINKWGGAERVLLALHKMYPQAVLYTSVYDKKKAKWAKVFPKVVTSFLQSIPFARSNHEFFAILMPIVFRLFDFSDFDIVISVTSEFAKAVKTNGKTVHICYCLTPTRYLWSGYDFYSKNPPSKFGFIPFFKLVSLPILNLLKIWDYKTAQSPNRLIAISTEVQKRIKRYYKRSSQIVFPPVNLRLSKKMRVTKDKKYYLVVGRLIPYKRIDLAINVFNELGYPLYIVGSGSEEAKLKKIANNNVKFLGHIAENKLSDIYINAKALIMPQEEDFGIVSLESQSCGIPVIAYNKGGVLDTVTDGLTGVLFKKQNIKSLKTAVTRFEKMKFEVDNLVENAKMFSEKNFRQNFARIVHNATKN